MFNKTFKTLDKYPKIYLGFAILAITNLIANVLGNYLAVNHFNEFTLFDYILPTNLTAFIILGSIILIIYTFLSVFLFPYLLTYIKNASYNNNTEETYKEILKKNWYKLLTVYIVTVALCIAICILFFNLSLEAGIDGTTTIILTFALSIIYYNCQIYMIAVITEDKFLKGIKNGFISSLPLIIPLFGTAILFNLPVYLITTAQEHFLTQPLHLYTYITEQASSQTFFTVIINILVIILYCVAIVFRDSFIYTYLNHKYMEE